MRIYIPTKEDQNLNIALRELEILKQALLNGQQLQTADINKLRTLITKKDLIHLISDLEISFGENTINIIKQLIAALSKLRD